MTPDDYAVLVDSWMLSLQAERKSPETMRSYRQGAEQFLAYCADQGFEPTLTRSVVTRFTAHLVALGREATTVRSRQRSLRMFSAWLAAEGEIERDDLLGLTPPKLDAKVVKPLSDEQLQALIAACKGNDFRARRDEALVRFMAECLVRASETVVHMTVSGTDIRRGLALIVKAKGGQERVVPFGPQTARALDRYVRARRSHRLAATDKFWLGEGGKNLGYAGLWVALRYRAGLAGIADFHPHRLRHTGATRWLRKGGSEGGLMAVAGWSSREMIDRYTAATAAERAAEEARSLELGDL